MANSGRAFGIISSALVLFTLGSCGDEADEEAQRDRDATDERSTSTLADTSTTATTLSGVPPWGGDDGFYAVLWMQPPPCPPAHESGGQSRVDGVDGTCYDLNLDTELDVHIVESADVAIDEQLGTHQVTLVFTEAGIERFNVLASECYEATGACPLQQVAIVANGYVVSAPTIDAPSFQRDEVVVSTGSGMTEDEAGAIADALDG